MEDLTAFGAPFQWNRTGDAVIGINAVDRQLMKLAVALAELKLRPDGLALALLFR